MSLISSSLTIDANIDVDGGGKEKDNGSKINLIMKQDLPKKKSNVKNSKLRGRDNGN